MRTLVPLVALGVLVGCGGLSKKDLAKVVSANDAVTQDWSSSSGGSGAREATDTGQNATIDGTVTGTGDWSGSVDWSGTESTDGSGDVAWSLALTYNDVTYDGYVLNGDVTDVVTVSGLGSGDGSYAHEMKGTLDVTGDASGSADFDYTATASWSLSSGTYSYAYTGEINGEQVSSLDVSASY